jgi:hypothetical protein
VWLQVLRDGKWQELDASVLVPGDIISIRLGDIVPADARLLEGDSLKIDQAITELQLPCRPDCSVKMIWSLTVYFQYFSQLSLENPYLSPKGLAT